MLRSKPSLGYSGLTIIMSNPSRMDTHRLLAGNGGMMFTNFCLRPEYNQMMCDVRLKEEIEPLLPNTKCILILGESAMHQLLPETLGNTLHEMRGSLFFYKNIPTICSYLPQDSVDIYKNYEKENNPLSGDYTPDDSVSDDGEEDEGDVKRHGKTKRSNYAFWLRADVKKCKQILQDTPAKDGEIGIRKCYEKLQQPKYVSFSPSSTVTSILLSTKGQFLYLDLETDYEQQNLQCFSFSFDGQTIYNVPILDYSCRPAYPDYYLILRALAIAIRDNTTVAHNGANFDFLVLANKYRIPIGKTYDTLIAMHRCFPDVEKSLGHCTSYWTWEKFHKDEDSRGYRTHDQMMARMKYCGKDVYTMYLIKQAIDSYAKTIPGLQTSIDDAMSCIRPYLISTIQGINVNEQLVNEMCGENDKLMMEYNRLTEWFIGPQGMEDIRQGKKLGMFAGSNKQCVKYFHTLLGYPVVAKGKEDKYGERKPSLGKKALYKLALKHENPVISLICAYRSVRKETSRLRFTPWPSITYERTSTRIENKEGQSSLLCNAGETKVQDKVG